MKKRIAVVGAGFGGIATATTLASKGHEVTVFERNDRPGGRARMWESKGFTFDMGPSWYLMPEVFERYFADLGARREDYYGLSRMDPYYQVFFGDGTRVEVDGNFERTLATFESLEKGGAEKLKSYLAAAKYKYDVAVGEFLYRDYDNLFQFFNRKLITQGLKLDVFQSLDGFVRRSFSDIRARQLLEYAMVFLGASPSNAPALYSIMSHVDLSLGVWFPKGGMWSVVEGMERLARERGVRFEYGAPVGRILGKDGRVTGVRTAAGDLPFDVVVANADYAHVELDLLEPDHRSYGARHWEKATWAPSMFIAYLGLDTVVPELRHHNLYFRTDWDAHFDTIFKTPSWPEDPCFYLSVVSKTDPSVAPKGKENLFLLVPVAPGLDDRDEVREPYFERVMDKLESLIGRNLMPHVEVKRLFSQRDFAADYNAYGGTALGLAHTLLQTAVFRPARRSRRLRGLHFAGQYTHPGVGVPMTLIASRLAAESIEREVG